MYAASIGDVRSFAREYTYWISDTDVLSEDQIEQVALRAADRWWEEYGQGWFSYEDISKLYEYVDEELLKIARGLP